MHKPSFFFHLRKGKKCLWISFVIGGGGNRLSCYFLWMMPPFPVKKKKRFSCFFAKLHLFGVCLQNVDVLFSLTAPVSKLCFGYYSTSFRSFFFSPFFIDSISSCACYLMLHVKNNNTYAALCMCVSLRRLNTHAFSPLIHLLFYKLSDCSPYTFLFFFSIILKEKGHFSRCLFWNIFILFFFHLLS